MTSIAYKKTYCNFQISHSIEKSHEYEYNNCMRFFEEKNGNIKFFKLHTNKKPYNQSPTNPNNKRKKIF